jgi:hypothetical protein
MENRIKNLLKLKLDLSHFFNVDFTMKDIRLMAYYTQQAEEHIIKKGFIKQDYCHQDNDDMLEYEKDDMRIILVIK